MKFKRDRRHKCGNKQAHVTTDTAVWERTRHKAKCGQPMHGLTAD